MPPPFAPDSIGIGSFSMDTATTEPSGYTFIPKSITEGRVKDRNRIRAGNPYAPVGSTDQNWVTPPQNLFGAIYNMYNRAYYSRFDEALVASYTDALAMRRDPFVEDLIRRFKQPIRALSFQVECEDPDDPDQSEAASEMQRIIEAIPNLSDLKNSLLEAVFYGKAASQVRFGPVMINGQRRITCVQHMPVNGDKIIWGFGLERVGVLVLPTWRPRYKTRSYLDHITYADRGTVYWLEDPRDRQHFIIHKFEPTDTDYLHESQMAMAVGGLGMRSRLYWGWTFRVQLATWIFNALQRLSVNGQYYGYYPLGNAKAKAAVEAALKQVGEWFYTAFPYDPTFKSGDLANLVKNIPPSTVAYDTLIDVLHYFDAIMERVVLGSNREEALPGTQGSKGVREQGQSMAADITRINADSLAETMTTQLIPALISKNQWWHRGKIVNKLPYRLMVKFQVSQTDVLQKAQVGLLLRQMEVPLDATDLRDQAGFKAPKDDAVALGAAPGQEGGAMIPGMGAGPTTPSSANGNGNGKPPGMPVGQESPLDNGGNFAIKGGAPGPFKNAGKKQMPPTYPQAHATPPRLVRGERVDRYELIKKLAKRQVEREREALLN